MVCKFLRERHISCQFSSCQIVNDILSVTRNPNLLCAGVSMLAFSLKKTFVDVKARQLVINLVNESLSKA
ncbi:hypothetical protein E2C01_017443 [Portunus trituberculatus]|uniref:Uncharacterized protein n=1 Tax=Portunus trituberculatus TaxID=210409 RepID=A0A5B7DRP5_PORTR|nr:hypothetical protein [Portunus trituberculatus]